MTKIVLLAVSILTLVFIGACSDAQTQDDVSATAGWSPPTYGTPVEHYVLQHSINGAPWNTVTTTPDTLFSLVISYFDDHRVRVAGVDAEGRQGPFSLPSSVYNPSETRPGAPGNVRLEASK